MRKATGTIAMCIAAAAALSYFALEWDHPQLTRMALLQQYPFRAFIIPMAGAILAGACLLFEKRN